VEKSQASGGQRHARYGISGSVSESGLEISGVALKPNDSDTDSDTDADGLMAMPGTGCKGTCENMTDTRQYIFAPAMGPRHVYELDDEGLTWHPPDGETLVMPWAAIQYLEERQGQRVDVVSAATDETVPVYYATQDFPDLMERLCSRLAVMHRERMEVITFRATRSYFKHFSVVIGVLIAFFMAGVLFLNFFEPAMLLVVAMTLPIGISLVLQPIEVTPHEDGLRVRDFCRRRLIPYADIRSLDFDVRGDLNLSFLRIMLTLNNGRRIKISRFENLVLLFIIIKARRPAPAG
jgi:hypothetical protein